MNYNFIACFGEDFLHPADAKVVAEIKARIPYLKEVPGYKILKSYNEFSKDREDYVIDSLTINEYKIFMGLDVFNIYDELYITKSDVENRVNDILEKIGERHNQ